MLFFVVSGVLAVLLFLAGFGLGRKYAPTKEERAANWTSAMAAVAAAVVGAGAVYYSSKDEQRENQLLTQRYAENVHLEEAPDSFYGPDPEAAHIIIWVVANYNRDVQLNEVWVESESGRDIGLGPIPPCTYRPLPTDFDRFGDITDLDGSAVHFKDLSRRWRRYVNGLLEPKDKVMPDSAEPPEESIYSAPRDVENCGAVGNVQSQFGR